MARYINRFTTIPKELFRINNGPIISIRDRAVKKTGSYDIVSEAGKVKPKAITSPETYRGPNGASLRPNTPMLHQLVRNFTINSGSVVIYSIPKATPLPDNLVLVHERGDHYSLQPAQEMTLQELNASINNLFATKGEIMTKSEWRDRYQKPTERS